MFFRMLVFLCVLISPLTHAVTFTQAPQPPDKLFRIDDRDPSDIFRSGFRPWMTSTTPGANQGFYSHISGNSVRDRTTPWVSASGSLYAADFTLRDLARQRRGTFPSTTWVYEISPLADSYSVSWALRDAMATFMDLPSSARDQRRMTNYTTYLMQFDRQDEWATRDGFLPFSIQRAVQYTVSEGEWSPTGVVRQNPGYVATLMPGPQNQNPLFGLTPVVPVIPPLPPRPPGPRPPAPGPEPFVDDTVQGFEIQTEAEIDDLGHSYLGTSFLAAALSCMGTAPFTTHRTSRSSVTQPTCDASLFIPTPLPTLSYPSKLAITTHDGNKWCFNPTLTADFVSYYGGQLSLGVSNCTDDAFNKATLDITGRLTYYWGGINYCVTAPKTVTEGSSNWDWIRLNPCDLQDPNQRWSLYKGKLYSGNSKMYIQDWKYYAILSKNNSGYDSTLDVSRMSSDFFTKTSAPQDHQSEIKLGWVWRGTTYYPTFALAQPWSSIYSTRTYYDSKTGQFFLLTTDSQAFVPVRTPKMKCLVSNEISSKAQWDWANWELCNQRDVKNKAYSFYFKNIKNSTPSSNSVTRVGLFNVIDSLVWATGTGSKAGYFFTSRFDYSTNATKVFEIQKSSYEKSYGAFSSKKN